MLVVTRSALLDETARAVALADAVSETTSDAVIGHDADGLITTWNTAAERIFGAPGTEMIGTSFTDFLDRLGWERWSEVLARVRLGDRVALPSVNLRRNGSAVDTGSAQFSPLRDAAGAFLGCLLVVDDRTEEPTAQPIMAAGAEQLRRGEALASAGSFVLDSEDLAEQWSEGMHRIYRVRPGDYDGTRSAHLNLIHPDDRSVVASALSAALERGVVAELDHRLASDDATWIFLVVEPVIDQFGRVTGISGFCQDITVRKAAEATVREALLVEQQVSDRLRQLDSVKDDFLSTVSHELRTPLTSISGFAGVLAKMHPELSELVQPIERNATEMSQLVERLLDFCRLSAGQVVVRRQPVALARLVAGCLPQSGVVQPAIHNEIPEDLEVLADLEALRRIVGNLLSNAVRYAGPDGVTVAATSEPSGATVLSVADSGPGIAPIYLDRLFDRFYQVPGDAARRGTGIGLTIVREYVDRLGGSVWCESTPGTGTTFFVRLP
jgi:PAS domain S-box-containing protein